MTENELENYELNLFILFQMVGPKPVKPKSVKTAKSGFEKPTSIKKKNKIAAKAPEAKEEKKTDKKDELISSSSSNGVKKAQVELSKQSLSYITF